VGRDNAEAASALSAGFSDINGSGGWVLRPLASAVVTSLREADAAVVLDFLGPLNNCGK
jgi:hypothetical protein